MTAEKKVPTEKREAVKKDAKRIRNRNRGKDGNVADYAAISPELLGRLIAAVTARECAIQFGFTRDGGAYCVRIVGDNEPYNEYIRPTEDVEAHLEGIVEDFSL